MGRCRHRDFWARLVGERLAAEHVGGANEIIDVAGFFELREGGGDGRLTIQFDARSPEIVVKMNGGEGDGLHRIRGVLREGEGRG